MTDTAGFFAVARNLAADLLRREPTRTPERIAEIAAQAASVASQLAPGVSIDPAGLVAELRHLFSVEIDAATALDDNDPTSHVAWLEERRAGIKWRFWDRYVTYLERDFGMPPTVLTSVGRLTDMILGRLEEPTREGAWDRRGMVVGSVQSGKTANYIGLICKALDAGYKLVIILAGIHSNLRSQTQLRVDEGVLGFDTQKSRRLDTDNRWIGVGLHGAKLHVHSLTSSAEDGDFNKKVADNIGVMLGSDPVVLVVKKNSKLLNNLLTWVRGVAGTKVAGKDDKLVRGVPLLLIDDEADHASVNTKSKKAAAEGEEDSVTAINGKIRGLLSTFVQSAYVGYTATPFANIFINPAAQNQKLGDDIFPRSFIINVKPPSNYVGPAKVFGLEGDPDSDIPAEQGLDITRIVKDYADSSMFPPKHKKDHEPTALPETLHKAIRCFVLACSARRARQQIQVHNSMLVHVTRFVDVQERVVRLVREDLATLQRRLEFGDGGRSPSVTDELRKLWEDEFVSVCETFPPEDAGSPVTWAEVERELHPAAAKIVVRPINGSADEVLDYKDNEKVGLSVIAVGGDKLSRGLTLEGLSVSYFLRTSQMYDTLMQMGRWFGYRKGYLDLCRLFTTETLIKWYRHIALADVELRREFDYMVAANKTPKEYGLRVRTHPDGMTVTALNKMCHSQVLELSWEGALVQTVQLPRDETRVGSNLSKTAQLVAAMPPPRTSGDGGPFVWSNVPGGQVASFIEALAFPPHSARASGKQLADFIRAQGTKPEPELNLWTVALISSQGNQKGRTVRKIHNLEVGLVERGPSDVGPDSFSLPNANMIDPKHQSIDLSLMNLTEELLDELRATKEIPELDILVADASRTLRDVGVEITRKRIAAKKIRGSDKTRDPNGRVARELRPKTHGLLLIYPLMATETATLKVPPAPPIIGVALSFPSSSTAEGIEYRVNTIWRTEMEDDADYED